MPVGPNYGEAPQWMAMITDTTRIASLEIFELDPAFDEHSRTAIVAVDLVGSLLGKSTLTRR